MVVHTVCVPGSKTCYYGFEILKEKIPSSNNIIMSVVSTKANWMAM